MEKSYREFLVDLIAAHGDRPKLAACIAGGGVSIADILKMPGASSVIHGIYLPYATEDTAAFLDRWSKYAADDFRKKSVQQSVAWHLAGATRDKYKGQNVICVGITAAITTGRPRKGENVAYINVITKTTQRQAKLTFSRLPEDVYTDTVQSWAKQIILAKREDEDQVISKVTLLLAFDPDNAYLTEMQESGALNVSVTFR